MRKAAILLIEDSEADVMLMKLALSEAGAAYDMVSFSDGAKAQEYVRTLDQDAESPLPDIALLDLNIPKVDGLELLEKIRSSKRLSSISVIVLSSSPLPANKSAFLRSVNAKFMLKPSDLEGYMQLGRSIMETLGPAA